MFFLSGRRAAFRALYDKKRFQYIHGELHRQRIARLAGPSLIPKTACLYGPRFNVYIDTSDGVNEDLSIPEYGGRMLRVIEDAAGEPFLFLKCSFSAKKSYPLQQLAESAGGKVIPFFQWPHTAAWFDVLEGKTETFRAIYLNARKQHDVFMGAGLTPYRYPRPNASDPRASWQDFALFGIGSPQDTGFFTIATRCQIDERLRHSTLRYDFTDKIPYSDYLTRSFASRAVVIPPGIGEYSQRLFDHGWLGQCMLLRKSTYDFAVSWKEVIPEIDFAAPDAEQEIRAVVENFAEWGEKTRSYFREHMSARSIVAHLQRAIAEFTETSVS